MGKYIVKRIFYILAVLLLLSFLVFAVYNMLPVDKAADMAMQEIAANKNLIYAERYLYWQRRYGLDGSLLTRYFRWLGFSPFYSGEYNGLLQGNLGSSIVYGKPVVEVVKEPLLNTVFLNLFGAVAALGITIPLGIFCAEKKGSKRDLSVQVGTIVGYSMPVFITAILFIWLLAVKIPIFPVSGMSSVGKDYTGFCAFLDKLYHFALPLIVMIVCHDEIRAGVYDRRFKTRLRSDGAGERGTGTACRKKPCLAKRFDTRRGACNRLAYRYFFRFDYDRKYFRY